MKKQFGYEYQLSDDDLDDSEDIIKSKQEKDNEDKINKEKKLMEI